MQWPIIHNPKSCFVSRYGFVYWKTRLKRLRTLEILRAISIKKQVAALEINFPIKINLTSLTYCNHEEAYLLLV